MRRLAIVLLSLVFTLVVSAQKRRAVPSAPDATVPQNAGAPLPGLAPSELAAFNAGRGAFNRDAQPLTGLGPVFNDTSCQQCHNAAAPGGGSNRNVTRFARRVNGTFDAMPTFGGSLVQNRAIGGGRNGGGVTHNFAPETVPPQATIVAQRRTTPLFGLGLVDATPDATFIALAAAQAARGDGTAGRVNMTDNIRAGMKTAGRFGWKAQVPTLFQFAGDALVNEMGITTPDFPDEVCPQGNCAELSFNPAPGLNDSGTAPTQLTNFMLMLAAPARGPQNADTLQGEQVFNTIGCASCHVTTLTTGASAIAALDHKSYHPYSDFLLHDMGALGDGLEMASATGSEVRTAPLWGLRFINRYLHDGRATTLEQAIAAHDGQGRTSRDTFAALSANAKAQLLAFLRSL
ncbi:MAG TPA: di-heme oxidoredictase family protein [Thermoanaerobaculia bacterium]|nr:di-heme oxidoredictase family protein [Thermoanaerobaculia bacterium]